MWSKFCATAFIALSMIASTHATNRQCGFVSRDAIFPVPALNGADGILRITENGAGGTLNGASRDDQVRINVTFHAPDPSKNEYYIMSAVTPNNYDSFIDTDNDNNATSTSLGSGGESRLDGTYNNALQTGDVIFSSHRLQINGAVCSELDCVVKYHLLYEIGAGPSTACSFSRTGKSSVYVRAHYSIKLELHYRRIEGKVDFTNWHSLVVSTDVLLTQQDVDRFMEFDAENVQSIAQFDLGSNLLLDGDDNGACLSSSAQTQNSTGAVGTSGATHTGASGPSSRCTVRGYAYIEQKAAAGNTYTPGFDDQDADIQNSALLYRDDDPNHGAGGVQMWLAQYSQMGNTQDDDNEHARVDEPTNFNATHAGANANIARKVASGDDYRLDVCEVYGKTLTQVKEDGTGRKIAVASVTKGHFDEYEFGAKAADDFTDNYIAGSSGQSLVTDINSQDNTVNLANINAFVACEYQLDAPTSCLDGTSANVDCTYTPVFYLAAWFDESIPANAVGQVEHVHYDNIGTASTKETQENTHAETTGTDTGNGGNLNDYDNDQPSGRRLRSAPTRRLRSAPKLLRAAAKRQLAAPVSPKRVHFMRVHLTHKH